MSDTFKFSLYELFGYLLPGTVALAGITLLDIVVFHHGHHPSLAWIVSKPGIAAGLCLAYFSGHTVQILANAIFPKSNGVVLKSKKYKTTRDLLKKVRDIKDSRFTSALDEDIINTCDGEIIAGGPSNEREIYVYREGYYRGTAIGLIIVGAAGLLIAVVPTYYKFLTEWGTSRIEICVGTLLSLAIAYGMYQRSIRFANYRIALCLTYSLLPPSREPRKITIGDGQSDEDANKNER